MMATKKITPEVFRFQSFEQKDAKIAKSLPYFFSNFGNPRRLISESGHALCDLRVLLFNSVFSESLRPLCLFAAILFISGCTMGPDYKSPDLALPGNYRDAPESTSRAETPSENREPETVNFSSLLWPALFTDSTLQALVRESLQANRDILIAADRVQQSRELYRQSRAALFPSLNAGALASRGRNERSANPAFNNGITTDDATVTVGASWEIDFWGRVRRLDEVARARYLAVDETRRAVTLSLIAEVASAYYQLLTLDRQLAIAHRATNSYQTTLRIFNDRRVGGVASGLETSRAQAALSQAQSAVPELQRQIAVTENQLSLLLGRPPGAIARAPRFPDADLIAGPLATGIPADLIARRPDLRATEQNLRAANAAIGASIAAYYPTLSLSALLGRTTNNAESFGSGVGNLWSIAGGVTQPIFEGGRLRSQTRQARAAFDEALHQHEQSVLSALVEVANSLIGRAKYAEATVQQIETVKALTDAVDVSLQRYDTGKASYYEVLDAQQQLYPAEQELAISRLNQILSTIQLYKALGGGWSEVPPETR